jgi:DNA repair protein RAD50
VALNGLISSNREIFEKAVGKELSPSTADSAVRATLTALSSEHSAQQAVVDDATRSLNEIQATISLQRRQIEKHMQERWELKEEIEGVLGEEYTQERYESLMETLEAELVQLSREVEQGSFAKDFYSAAIDIAKSDGQCCVLCERKFEDRQDLSTFIESVTEKLERLQDIAGSKAEMDHRTEYIERARALAPSISRATKLDYEIELLESELSENESELERAQRSLEARSDKLSEIKSKIDVVEGFRKVVLDLNRYQRDIQVLDGQIEMAEQSLPEIGLEMSTSEMHNKMAQLNNEAKAAKVAIAEIMGNKERLRVELTQQRTALSNNTLKLHRMEAEIKEKHLKLLRVEELQRGIVTHQEVIAGVNIELDQSIAMIQVTEKALSEAKAESLTKERELGRELSSVAQALSEMESIMASVTEYAGREAKLFDCQNRVVSLLGEIENAQSAIDRSTEKLSVAEKALVDMRGHERNLRDNHEVRRMRHEIDEMNETITSLEAQHAEQEKENYEREASRLQQKYVKLNSNFSSRMGEIKQMDDQLARETEELNSRFKDHGENYRRALISLRTVEVANEDLAKYAKALDSAIMTYHSMKMEEINRIVDELWKKTYTGTDVDTIMIRSDNENSRGNRSYNYRVCMMKQDVELDMRGRCSAGQKVLASIIIRLALAECFGKNCGVIALDEPTTNLDSDNIESLANALSAIIETRRVQKNFQLIVITHDEHFLRHMNAAAYTDHFFRVERNPHQLSKISVVPISRVTE